MKTKRILNSISTMIVILSITIMGCKKDLDTIQPNPEGGQLLAGPKASAAGSIVSSGTVINGVFYGGIALNSANSVTLKVTITTAGTYNISSNTVNGYNFSKSGSFTSTGTQYVTLPGNGTPLATGINTFTVTFGTNCTFAVVVVNNAPIVQITCNQSYTYYEVANQKTQKVWLDRNLGANRIAQSATDYQSYGSLFQWGRLADDHQCINWSDSYSGTAINGVTTTTSTSNTPGNSLFVKTVQSPYDWKVPQNNNLWQGVSGINNPCPSGYRLPTSSELTAEVSSWTSKNTAGAFGSPLKWTVAGYRDFPDGEVYDSGNSGAYWSSTVSNTSKAMVMWFSTSGGYTISDFRAVGYSVRCIKN